MPFGIPPDIAKGNSLWVFNHKFSLRISPLKIPPEGHSEDSPRSFLLGFLQEFSLGIPPAIPTEVSTGDSPGVSTMTSNREFFPRFLRVFLQEFFRKLIPEFLREVFQELWESFQEFL